MDIATAKRVSTIGAPVVYKGVQYERITKRITNVTPGKADTYSLELLDYCGSAVVIAPMSDVEAVEPSSTAGAVPLPPEGRLNKDTEKKLWRTLI